MSTGSQSSKPSHQQCRSASLRLPATQRCASASENGPDWSPSIETYHSSSSCDGGAAGFSIACANAACSGDAAITDGVKSVGRTVRRASAAAGASASGSGIPSRTVMTFAQFLQRILRILPRTRSSAIE